MKHILPCGLLCILTLTACVNPDDIRTLDNRVYQQKLRIDKVEQNMNSVSSTNSEQADSWSQMQSMRRDLATLQGEVESLRNTVEKQQALIQANEATAGDVADIKTGWHRMNSQLALDIDLDQIKKKRLAREATQRPASSLTPQALPTQRVNSEPNPDTPAKLDTPTAKASAAPAPTPSPDVKKASDPAKALYDSARSSFEARKYAQGQRQWEEFVENFPKHKLVPNALFWQGECYYQEKDYARAVLKYQDVLDKYKKSSKYHTALFKQGLSFMRLGRVKAGRLLLQDVVNKFPKTPEAKRAQAILKK